MFKEVIGRSAELAALEAFLDGLVGGVSAVVLEGEAGIGKTTLWTACCEQSEATGARVLVARPAESETALTFSGIRDLLDVASDEALAALPPPQRRALARALLLDEADGPSPDAHAIGVALLTALRDLAASRPLLLAVDDVQWLDAETASALAFAGRRLQAETVGFLLARRTNGQSVLVDELCRSLPPGRFAEVRVGPLELGALNRVVHEHLGVTLPRPLLAEVHEASGGNPFFALEIIRMLRRSGISVEAGRPLPLPDSLRDLVHGRLLTLPADSREFLLVASAVSQPTVGLVESASGVGRDAGLAPALEARIVGLDDDRIRFTHPLLAAGVYEGADPIRRARVHRRLAEVVEDPEARARHLAASVTDPDEEVAAALEDAATRAQARGAPRSAALLLDRASELTPTDRREEALRRAVEAAYLHYQAGDSPRAEAQLRDVIVQLPRGPDRARALMRLARVRAYVELADAAELFLRAVDEADGDFHVLAVSHEGVATCFFRLNERLAESVEHAELAVGFALEIGDSALAAEALATRWVVEALLGRDCVETRARALALQDAAESLRVLAQPRFTDAAVQLLWTNALARARDDLVALLERATEIGDESSRPLVLAHLAELECELGELDSALVHAAEAEEEAAQAGQETVFAFSLAVESLVEAQRGGSDRARRLATLALELMPKTRGREAEVAATRALGQLELSLGAPEAVVATLERLVAFVRSQSIAEPGFSRFVVDHVEALIELGRRDEAVELLDWYEGNARRLERVSALAGCLRCRGLLLAEAGAVDDAIAAYEQALELHAQVEIPLDRGRTLIALGAAQRRAKRRREARETLEAAVTLLEWIGAAIWADRARAELRRISGRAAVPGELTPAEDRVARLVAEGKTNREVAAALFLSDRTVEGHLSRVFVKLGVRSRTELAHVLASGSVEGGAMSNTGDSPLTASPPSP